MAEQYAPWNAMAKNIAYGAWAIALLIVIGHIIRLATISGKIADLSALAQNRL